jgi:hypothetical protein
VQAASHHVKLLQLLHKHDGGAQNGRKYPRVRLLGEKPSSRERITREKASVVTVCGGIWG